MIVNNVATVEATASSSSRSIHSKGGRLELNCFEAIILAERESPRLDLLAGLGAQNWGGSLSDVVEKSNSVAEALTLPSNLGFPRSASGDSHATITW